MSFEFHLVPLSEQFQYIITRVNNALRDYAQTRVKSWRVGSELSGAEGTSLIFPNPHLV
jgi:hypothetical protein